MAEFRRDVKISEFTIGRVVYFGGRYGHVDGFALNLTNDTIIVVKRPEKTDANGGYTYSYVAVHPNNLTLEK